MRTTTHTGRSVEQFKNFFFDRQRITSSLDRALGKRLRQHGGTTRKIAQRSLRYRKEKSRPGQPPSAHKSAARTKRNKKTGAATTRSISLLREFIFFGYDPKQQVVIIGPALLNGTRGSGALTTPQVLEYGGPVRIPRKGRTPIVGTHPARPYMRPAHALALKKFLPSLKDSMR